MDRTVVAANPIRCCQALREGSTSQQQRRRGGRQGRERRRRMRRKSGEGRHRTEGRAHSAQRTEARGNAGGGRGADTTTAQSAVDQFHVVRLAAAQQLSGGGGDEGQWDCVERSQGWRVNGYYSDYVVQAASRSGARVEQLHGCVVTTVHAWTRIAAPAWPQAGGQEG